MGCCEGRSRDHAKGLDKSQECRIKWKNISDDPMYIEIEKYVKSIRQCESWVNHYSESDLQIESLAGSIYSSEIPVYKLTISFDGTVCPQTIYEALFDSSIRLKWDGIVSEMEVKRKDSRELCYKKLSSMGFSRDFYETQIVKHHNDFFKVIAYSVDGGKHQEKCPRAHTFFSYTEIHNGFFETILQSDLKSSMQNISALMIYPIKFWKNQLKNFLKQIEDNKNC